LPIQQCAEASATSGEAPALSDHQLPEPGQSTSSRPPAPYNFDPNVYTTSSNPACPLRLAADSAPSSSSPPATATPRTAPSTSTPPAAHTAADLVLSSSATAHSAGSTPRLSWLERIRSGFSGGAARGGRGGGGGGAEVATHGSVYGAYGEGAPSSRQQLEGVQANIQQEQQQQQQQQQLEQPQQLLQQRPQQLHQTLGIEHGALDRDFLSSGRDAGGGLQPDTAAGTNRGRHTHTRIDTHTYTHVHIKQAHKTRLHKSTRWLWASHDIEYSSKDVQPMIFHNCHIIAAPELASSSSPSALADLSQGSLEDLHGTSSQHLPITALPPAHHHESLWANLFTLQQQQSNTLNQLLSLRLKQLRWARTCDVCAWQTNKRRVELHSRCVLSAAAEAEADAGWDGIQSPAFNCTPCTFSRVPGEL